jgi:hypothetical protein
VRKMKNFIEILKKRLRLVYVKYIEILASRLRIKFKFKFIWT